MSLDDVLTQRRWDLQDGLWLLMGIYISRIEEVGKLYERAAQVSQDAIDKYALSSCGPLEKAQSLIDIRSALQGYRDTRYFPIRSNDEELEWPEFEVDYHAPFENTDFAKSELYLISVQVEKLYEQFKKTAEPEYCELPYTGSGDITYPFSPISLWNRDYLIEWGIEHANLDLTSLLGKIQLATAREAGVNYTVTKATHNKAGYFKELERWLLTYPKSPMAKQFIEYLENDTAAKERAHIIDFFKIRGTGFVWQDGSGTAQRATLKTISNVISNRIERN
ncbi:MAG: hypothetical protein O3C37_11125 [Proteobacteria bacterium]|nr:hypothetical protein [Pseudomonadota bacterium]